MTGAPTVLPADLAGWPSQHARLALVGPAAQRPPLARARRSGAVIWVSARPDPPRDLARATAGAGWLVTPLAGQDGRRRLRGRGLRRPPDHAQGGGGLGGGRVSERRAADLLQLALFAALGSFAALHWASLVESPPVGRILLAVAALAAVGAAVAGAEPLAPAAAGRARSPRWW